MPITTTDSMLRGGQFSGRERCWDCNQHSVIMRIDPRDGRLRCQVCGNRVGLDYPIELSDEPVGTIEPAKKADG